MRKIFRENLKVAVDPHFDMDGNLVSGYIIEEYKELLEELGKE
jgi:hypothetical protein